MTNWRDSSAPPWTIEALPRLRVPRCREPARPSRETFRVDLGSKLQLKNGQRVTGVLVPESVAPAKSGQLGTDLNRDSLAALLSVGGIQPVRQIALDTVWSALRFRPA